MKFFKPLDIMNLLAITLLFIYDYFPESLLAYKIPKFLVISAFFGIIILSFLLKRYRNRDSKEILKWQLTSTIYILLLMSLLTALGGESVSGLSLDSGLVWIVLLFSIYEMSTRWRKVNQSNTVKEKDESQ
ncbi:hypothetical protein SAMN05192533_11862 [Mesobacillus persicus]|uniref:Uncharacterized protein n=1 Tax=Mesobacillus persicus TaxID=930146 RepID=A0A1H8IVA0_9BACI|nr:hypothetical protein [Mesobacillus persicus]SEN72075.1 hypothetical protein SAMN05192533_11862 [Mesobacillus persicus]